MTGAGGPLRESRVVSSHMDLGDVSGRVLFPTLTQGPWLPFLRFAETTSTGGRDDSGGHHHKGEEVMNYVVEGRVEYEDDVDRRSIIDQGSIALLIAREEAHHNLIPSPGSKSRWLSVVVKCPPTVGGPAHGVNLSTGPNPTQTSEGTFERRLVGRNAPIPSASGLECVEIEFREDSQCVCPIGPERRGVAYLFDGTGSIDGQRVDAGAAVLTENSLELTLRGASGCRILLVSAPR
ncbi:MAG: hypothetical protein WAK40_02070 [Thermoplasmata archaeon]